jgi:hypothetical protein
VSRSAPHFEQNLASELFSKAQLAHRLQRGVPHRLQKCDPRALSVPQFEHRIALPDIGDDQGIATQQCQPDIGVYVPRQHLKAQTNAPNDRPRQEPCSSAREVGNLHSVSR